MPNFQTRLATQDLVESSSTQPIYLSLIEVVGGESFSTNFFDKILQPLQIRSDYTLEQLLRAIDSSYSRLIKTEVVKNADVTIYADYAKQIPKITSYNPDKLIPARVVFDILLVQLNSGEAFLNLNSDDLLNLNLNYLNNNFFENAEVVNLGVNYNPYKPNQHLILNGHLAFNLPNPLWRLVTDLFNTNANNQLWMHLNEHTTGLFSGLQYTSNCKRFLSIIGVNASRRFLLDIAEGASTDVLNFGGNFFKKAVFLLATYSRVHYLNPITRNFITDGFSLSFLGEAAQNLKNGETSDASTFFKVSGAAKLYKSIFSGFLTTQTLVEGGAIFGLGAETVSAVHTSDRFYLGGYNSFRGFSKNSVNTDGGLQFGKAQFTVFSRIPQLLYPQSGPKETNPLRLYATGGVASVGNDILNQKDVATSVGFGLQYFNQWANFDLGYYFTGRGGQTDRDGLQFGISIGGSNRTV